MHRILAVALLLALPMAAAHGAPSPREIDTRILADATDNGDYGAGGTLDEGGLDVLALDVYEATVPGSTAPAVVFRIIVQGGDQDVAHRITFDFAAGAAKTYELATPDLKTYTSSTFAAVRGPFDVGDGHPKAIEGVIPLADLGIDVGRSITDVIVRSSFDGNDADQMPGSWYFEGVEIPSSPGSTATPGTYKLVGAKEWFRLEADAQTVASGARGTVVNLTLASRLDVLEQFVTLSVAAPSGIEARLSTATALLPPGASKIIQLNVTGFGAGDIQVRATSDLGLTRALSLPLTGDAVVGNGASVVGPLLAQGESFQYRFTTPAVFEYHCHPHPQMQGKVTIVADDLTDAPAVHIIRIVEGDAGNLNTFGFEPAELTVQVNDTVVWINEGLSMHNVHGTTGLDGTGHDHGDHHHDPIGDEGGKIIPAPGLVWVLLGLVLLARRR